MTQKELLYNLNFFTGYFQAIIERTEINEDDLKEFIPDCVTTLNAAKEYLNAWNKAKEEITRLLNADVPVKKSGLIEALYVMDKLDPESEGMKK